MMQEPRRPKPGGIATKSSEVEVGGSIEITTTGDVGSIEVLVEGEIGSKEFPVPPGGVVTVPVSDIPPGSKIVISDGGVPGVTIVVSVVSQVEQ